MKKLFLLLLFISTTYAQSLTYEGSFGGQYRILEKKSDSIENYNSPTDYTLIHGAVGAKYIAESFKLESSFFYRRADSDLYGSTIYTQQNILFPKYLVAREGFDLTKNKNTSKYSSDFLLHKFMFTKDFTSSRVELGRLFINYGLGETFNPINPFNLPNGLFVINDLTQSSDGMKYSYFINENSEAILYSFSNKNPLTPAHENHPTLFSQFNFRNEGNQLTLVGGLDQNRAKVGTEVSVQYLEYLAFFQTLYQFEKDHNQSLVDAMFGLDRQWTQIWHTRLEFSYQELETKTGISTRFLPQEYTIAIANEFETHPLLKLKPIITYDPKANIAFAIFKANLNLLQNLDLEAFALGNLNENKAEETKRQKLLTRDIGVRFQYYF